MLIERDVGESFDRERGCNRCRRYISSTQLRVVRPLPAMQQLVVFQVEAQRAVRRSSGARRNADGQIQIVIRAVSAGAVRSIRQMTDTQADFGRPSPLVADEILADN